MSLQTFPTDVGAMYVISFALSRNPSGTAANRTLLVTVGDVTDAPFGVSYDPDRTAYDMRYNTWSMTFQALDTTTTLSMREVDTPAGGDDLTGTVIDYVAVVPSISGESQRWMLKTPVWFLRRNPLLALSRIVRDMKRRKP